MKQVFDHTHGLAALETIAWRMPYLWLNAFAPTDDSRRETQRMVAEKQTAFVEGLLAAQTAWFGMLLRPWWQWSPAALAAASAGPAKRKVKANVRRLRRKGLPR